MTLMGLQAIHMGPNNSNEKSGTVHLSFPYGLEFERAPLHACFGLAVRSPAFQLASSCAADSFGFIRNPRPDWTIPSGLAFGYLDHAVPPSVS